MKMSLKVRSGVFYKSSTKKKKEKKPQNKEDF